MRAALMLAVLVAGCAPVPSAAPVGTAAPVPLPVTPRIVDFGFSLNGRVTQGGYLTGRVPDGALAVRLDGAEVPMRGGRFAIGFGRDAAGLAVLEAVLPAGVILRQVLRVEPREWAIERIPSLPGTAPSNPEYDRRRAVELAQVQAGKRTPADAGGWTQVFRWPASGRISGVYGSQRILGGVPRSPHYGVDVAAPRGTPVTAPADGVVTLARGPFLIEGNILMLNHGQGLVSVYLHLSAFDVAEGQRVRQGDVVGRIGTTGRSTGPHLHWGLSLVSGNGETRLDPELLVPAKVGGRTP